MTDHRLPRWVAVAGLALAVLSAAASAAPVVTALDNGLKVCVAEDPASDIVAVQIVVRATADCEPDDKAGLRTVLQHALRAASDKRVEGNEDLGFVLDMQDIGGGLSLNTDWEYVAIGYTGTSDTLPQALAFLADAVFRPALTEEVYKPARDLVQSAASGPESAPAESTISLFRLALLDRPARAYPLGTPKTIERISLADLAAFHRRYYVPSLSTVSIVGPVSPSQAQELVSRSFGALPAGDPALPSPPEAPTDSDVRVGDNQELSVGDEQRMDIASLVVGVPAPGLGDPDEVVTYVIHGLLGGNGVMRGRIDGDSKLWDALGLPFPDKAAKRNRFIESLAPPTSARSHLAIHAYVAPRQAEAMREALLDEFEGLAKTEPTSEELARAKEFVVGSYAALFASPSNRALLLGRAVALGLPVALEPTWTQKVMGVTAKDVRRVARAYFPRYGVGIEFPEAAQ